MAENKKLPPVPYVSSAGASGFKKTALPPARTPQKPEDHIQSLEEIIRAINDKVQKADVLSEGFNELRVNVTDIRHAQIKMESEVKSIRAHEATLKEKIQEINEAIYDPDNGIYRRINESITFDRMRDEKIDKALSGVNSIERVLKPLEKTEEDLKKIAGDDLKELQSIVRTRQIIDRMFWIMSTALVGAGAKILWDFIAALAN